MHLIYNIFKKHSECILLYSFFFFYFHIGVIITFVLLYDMHMHETRGIDAIRGEVRIWRSVKMQSERHQVSDKKLLKKTAKITRGKE